MTETPALDDHLRSLVDDAARATLSAALGDRARFDAPLAAETWWRVGGPADALVTVESEAELAAVLGVVFGRRLPWLVLGNASNVLVGDGGVRGVVVRLAGGFDAIDVAVEGELVVARAGGGAPMDRLVARCASLGAVGCDGLAGIPGTVGGSLRMNAGTDREIGEFVRAIRVQTPREPAAHAASATFAYRRSTLARDAVVASVELAFPRGDVTAVRTRLQERLVRRKATQPLQFPNAGSCFRNPPGDRAGRLIEAVGAKGWRIGDAEVSELHANFIVNRGAATARDVATLLARVRAAVEAETGVALELEVHFLGVFV